LINQNVVVKIPFLIFYQYQDNIIFFRDYYKQLFEKSTFLKKKIQIKYSYLSSNIYFWMLWVYNIIKLTIYFFKWPKTSLTESYSMNLFLFHTQTTSLEPLINGLLIPTNICLNPIPCLIELSAFSSSTQKISFSSKEDQSIKRLSHYVGPIPVVPIQIWFNWKRVIKMLNQ